MQNDQTFHGSQVHEVHDGSPSPPPSSSPTPSLSPGPAAPARCWPGGSPRDSALGSTPAALFLGQVGLDPPQGAGGGGLGESWVSAQGGTAPTPCLVGGEGSKMA